jgi:hypothetical protein
LKNTTSGSYLSASLKQADTFLHVHFPNTFIAVFATQMRDEAKSCDTTFLWSSTHILFIDTTSLSEDSATMQRYDCSRYRENGERCAAFVPVAHQLVSSNYVSELRTMIYLIFQGIAIGQRLCLCAHSEASHSETDPRLILIQSLPPKGGCLESQCPSFCSVSFVLHFPELYTYKHTRIPIQLSRRYSVCAGKHGWLIQSTSVLLLNATDGPDT